MLTAYINAAMRRAHYEILVGGEGYIGKIPSPPYPNIKKLHQKLGYHGYGMITNTQPQTTNR